MCPVPFNSARAFVALGSWLVEGTRYVCRQGLLRMNLLLTAVGVEKRGRISSWSSFYCGHHVTLRGCWYSVKQDHQFLNKISTNKNYYKNNNQYKTTPSEPIKPKQELIRGKKTVDVSGERDETTNRIISEFSKLARKEYKTWHGCVGKVIT